MYTIITMIILHVGLESILIETYLFLKRLILQSWNWAQVVTTLLKLFRNHNYLARVLGRVFLLEDR